MKTTKSLIKRHAAVGAMLSTAMLLGAVSCSSDKKPDRKESATPAKSGAASAAGTATFDVTPGEAGGVIEETITATATVRGVDTATRKVTLETKDSETTFTAPPEMRNLDQLKVGDRVTATVISRLIVFVDQEGAAEPAHAAAIARAPKGAKPGAVVAEAFEIVGTVKSIDATTRKAVLEFSDGQTKSLTVRPDVDLNRYKAGDNVVIRVSQTLMVLTETP
jgi:Cu/Ag efflux protein CusF